MLRLVLFLVALLTAQAQAITLPVRVQGGAINLSIVASRVSGVVPLAVTFSAAGTTSSGATYPFHDMQCSWNFGDSGAGVWTTGAHSGGSMNTHKGMLAGYVYQTASNYTVTATCTDGTNTSVGTIAITASAFSGTTWCITNGSDTTGCTGTAKTSETDFDDVIARCLAVGAPIRCSFKKGDSFASSTAAPVAVAGVVLIDSFGSGALPAITGATSGKLNFNSALSNDTRVVGLDFQHTSDSAAQQCVSVSANIYNLLLLNNTCDGGTGGFVLSAGSGPSTWNTCYNCIVQGNTVVSSTFARLQGSAVMGNTFGPGYTDAEHSARFQRSRYVTYNNNTFLGAGTGAGLKHSTALRGDPQSFGSYYIQYADNYMVPANTQTEPFKMSPSSDTEYVYISNVVNERNWYTAPDAAATLSMVINHTGTYVSVRDNLIDLTGASRTVKNGITFDPPGGVVYPYPNYVWAYNNTVYSPDGAVVTRGVWFGAEPTNAVAKNNLCYFPVGTGAGTGCVYDQSVGGTVAGNSSDAQTFTAGGVDPRLGANPTAAPLNTAAKWVPQTGSYAIGTSSACGTPPAACNVPLWSDFNGTAWSPQWSAGAVHP